MTLSLGIDIGTSGVRTAVLENNEPISSARASHPKQVSSQIDANDWWVAVENCLVAQMTALNDLGRAPNEIAAIAVDGTSGSMVLTDGDINPVGPGLMYNSKGFDAEAEFIASHAPESHITRGSNSALARARRLLSLAQNKPSHLLHQADFIAAKLVGRGGHSDFNNALKTGFDPKTELWPDWIGKVVPVALLPNVHAPGTELATISGAIADRFGLSRKVKVHAGTTDSIAAFLASAPFQEGVAVTSLGSTLAIKLLSKQRIDDPNSGLYSHRMGELWLIGGASNTGGAVLKVHFNDEDLERLSADINPATPLGLNYYPLLQAGERFPINDPSLKPRMEPRPPSDSGFLQAMLEGMARIERQCYEVIETHGGPKPTAIFTAGGGAKNPKWTEIRARMLGQTPQKPAHSEASIGAARLTTLLT